MLKIFPCSISPSFDHPDLPRGSFRSQLPTGRTDHVGDPGTLEANNVEELKQEALAILKHYEVFEQEFWI